MSVVVLPTSPGPRQAVPRVLDFGGYLEPSSGGPVQRTNRMGTRYAVAFAMPPMKNERDGRVWINRLIRGQQEGARMEYPLVGFSPGSPGAFTVAGAGQSGTTLAIEGGQPGYTFREGQPFSMIVGGQSYFDFIAETTVADAAGDAEITLSQMLRVSPADGDALNFAKPVIEGFLMGDAVSWELSLGGFVGLSFEIREAR